MKEYVRELYNFDPIPIILVSNQDHITPMPDAIASLYYVSTNGEAFVIGTGGVRKVGRGCYELLLDKSEHVLGTTLISIPGAAGNTGYDPVSFRIIRTQAQEIVPVNQRTVYVMMFLMIASSDHVSPKPLVFPTVSVSRDGSAFVTLDTFPVEIGIGFYAIEVPVFGHVPLSDFNDECIYTIRATAIGADDTYDSFQVFRYNDPA